MPQPQRQKPQQKPLSPPQPAITSEIQALGARLFDALRDNPSLRKSTAVTLDEMLDEVMNAGRRANGAAASRHTCPACKQPLPDKHSEVT